MRLWILYNKAAVQNSADLSTRRGRQISSNNVVLADPLGETGDEIYCIAKELERIMCDVPGLPQIQSLKKLSMVL